MALAKRDRWIHYLGNVMTISLAGALALTPMLLEIGAFLIGTETELILKSRRVVPKKLIEAGYRFRFTEIEEALKDLV